MSTGTRRPLAEAEFIARAFAHEITPACVPGYCGVAVLGSQTVSVAPNDFAENWVPFEGEIKSGDDIELEGDPLDCLQQRAVESSPGGDHRADPHGRLSGRVPGRRTHAATPPRWHPIATAC